MDLFRMRCFVNVAEHLNLTHAAAASGITQPAMSVQMRELERETGLQLLVRRKGRIALTDAGVVLRDGFIDILGLYESTLVKAQASTRAQDGVVRTGFHGSLTAFQPVYQGFRNLYPTLDVTMRIAEWQQLASMVASGELDVAFVEVHEAQALPELCQAPFMVERGYCVAASRANPLAERAHVTPNDLAGETVLMSAYKSASIDAMYRGLIASGVRRETIRRVEDVDCSIAMAAAGMGPLHLRARDGLAFRQQVSFPPDVHRSLFGGEDHAATRAVLEHDARRLGGESPLFDRARTAPMRSASDALAFNRAHPNKCIACTSGKPDAAANARDALRWHRHTPHFLECMLLTSHWHRRHAMATQKPRGLHRGAETDSKLLYSGGISLGLRRARTMSWGHRGRSQVMR